jgi:hypothetical protein
MTEQEKNQLIEEAKQRFPINSVVISTHGSRDTIKNHDFRFGIGTSTKNNIYYDDGNTELYHYDSKTWAGVISKPESNLNETKYDYEVVRCTTQEEWDFVIDNTKSTLKKEWFIVERNQDGSNDIEYKKHYRLNNKHLFMQNAKIYSFQEWCDKFGHKPDFKPKFEVGKWYKINNCWYAKFLTIHGSGTYWRHNESITSKGSYFNIADNIRMESINNFLEVKLLTDLNEIQQYLPDNHPDKIKVMKEESLVGRYLKALVDRPNGIGLANKGDYFIINDLTCCTLIKDGTNRWLYHLRNNISKDFELMPEGFNPLAISESTDTNWIPKVDDWVIFLGGYSDLKLNKAYQIQEHQFEDYYYLKGTGLAPKKDKHFRKALPHEIPNNEVVLTPETYGYSSDRYFISVGAEEHSITPKQAIKSIFDKDYSSPLNEVLELPKSSKKKTKQLIY